METEVGWGDRREEGREGEGESRRSRGLGFPDLSKLAAVFGLPFIRIENHAGLAGAIDQSLRLDGPVLCEVVLDVRQPLAPKASSRKLPDGRMVLSPLEDLAPFLPREELLGNLLVPTWEAPP